MELADTELRAHCGELLPCSSSEESLGSLQQATLLWDDLQDDLDMLDAEDRGTAACAVSHSGHDHAEQTQRRAGFEPGCMPGSESQQALGLLPQGAASGHDVFWRDAVHGTTPPEMPSTSTVSGISDVSVPVTVQSSSFLQELELTDQLWQSDLCVPHARQHSRHVDIAAVAGPQFNSAPEAQPFKRLHQQLQMQTAFSVGQITAQHKHSHPHQQQQCGHPHTQGDAPSAYRTVLVGPTRELPQPPRPESKNEHQLVALPGSMSSPSMNPQAPVASRGQSRCAAGHWRNLRMQLWGA